MKMNIKQILSASAFMGIALLTISAALNPAFAVAPVDWQMGFQEPSSSSAERIQDFHTLLMWIITGIVIFVSILLAIVILRFNAKANPTPAKFTHNVPLEVVWTVIPVLILLIIAVPSFRVLYKNDRIEKPDMTLKITGYQWYWGYEYPDHDDLSFNAYMVPDDEIDQSKGQLRMLSTDNVVVLPIETNIQILVTAADVIHAFAMPALGVKIDAIPGRTNETWFRIDRIGTYYGQCSELCGKDHSYMPIEIRAVTKEEFQKWLKHAKKEFAALDQPITIQLASIEGR